MADITTLTTFFGWCSVINIGILAFSTIVLTVFRSPISNLHRQLFILTNAEVEAIYFKFLGYYKLAIFIFNLTPYIALKIMV